MYNIPIITYHKVSDTKEFGLTTVSPGKFERQLMILKDLGYNSINFKDIDRGGSLPENPIIITFDDGYESVYQNALPILDKYGFKSVVYVITDFIGKYNTWEAVSFQQKHRHLSLSQLIDLQNNGFEIASHSKTHRFLPFLKGNEVQIEVEASKAYLEDKMGERIISFCYPYGRMSQQAREKVQKAGYKYATQNISLLYRANDDPLSLARRSIYALGGPAVFRSKIEKPFNPTFSRFSESIIQKGALASIALNLLQRKK